MIRTLENRIYGNVRDPDSAQIEQMESEPWNTTRLREHKYCLLTTYRKDGRAVHTPVWFGIAGEEIYVRSGGADGKIKRIRRNPQVLISPCTARGAPLGRPMPAAARILEPQEHHRAERALRARYGLGRKLYRLLRRRAEVAYIQIALG